MTSPASLTNENGAKASPYLEPKLVWRYSRKPGRSRARNSLAVFSAHFSALGSSSDGCCAREPPRLAKRWDQGSLGSQEAARGITRADPQTKASARDQGSGIMSRNLPSRIRDQGLCGVQMCVFIKIMIAESVIPGTPIKK